MRFCSVGRLGPMRLALLSLLGATAVARAEPLAENPVLLKQRVAALFAGRYASTSCYEQPNQDGRPAAAGDLRITPDGQVVVGPERAALFDPAGELGDPRPAAGGRRRLPRLPAGDRAEPARRCWNPATHQRQVCCPR